MNSITYYDKNGEIQISFIGDLHLFDLSAYKEMQFINEPANKLYNYIKNGKIENKLQSPITNNKNTLFNVPENAFYKINEEKFILQKGTNVVETQADITMIVVQCFPYLDKQIYLL